MEIITIDARENGSRPPIQTWGGKVVPSGYVEIKCDTTAFIESKGFVTLTIENGVCTAMEVNQEALDAWNAEHPDIPTPDTPTGDDAAIYDELAQAYNEGVQNA